MTVQMPNLALTETKRITVRCWYWSLNPNFQSVYEGYERSRNRVVVPARQATQPVGIGSLESILGLLKNLKIRALSTVPEGGHVGQKHEDYDDKTEELVGDVRMGLI